MDPGAASTFALPEVAPATVVTPSESVGRDRRWGDRYWGLDQTPNDGLRPPEGDWDRLIEWMGDSVAQTEVFNVPTDNWRLAWRALGVGTLTLEVFDEAMRRQAVWADLTIEEGTSYVRMPSAGAYFLLIHPDGVIWRVAVEAIR